MTGDESLRPRLAALDPGTQALSQDQREAIVQEITRRGPDLIASARKARAYRRTGAFAALAAAAATLLVLRPWRASDETPHEAPPAIARARACEADPSSVDVAPGFVVEPDGRGRLSLGARVEAIAEAGASVRIETARPCSTRLVLDHGAVTVHAKDLGGGELLVRTSGLDVVVRGTLFRVAAREQEVEIAVDHGRVSVQGRGAELASVTSAESVTVSGRRVTRGRLDANQREELVNAFHPRPAPKPVPALSQARAASQTSHVRPPPAIEELLTEAESRWRAGERDAARSLYRAAGARQGATAEGAWLRWARLELNSGAPEQALTALGERARRFGTGLLATEAAWLEVQALDRLGRIAEARTRARALIRAFPNSPQASAATRFVEAKERP